MHILVTGSEGQLGNELHRLLESGSAEIGPIDSCYQGARVDYADYQILDISDEAAVGAWFQNHEPYDLVINCAGITNVDGCESNYDAAYRVNAQAVGFLAKATQKQGGKFVHISTDYVFPGNQPTPRIETDEVGPISAYGRSKLAGEEFALANCEKTFILRTAWLYGYVGKNFVKTMLKLANSAGKLSVVCDQLGNPTSANDLAYEILTLATTEQYGIYHCTNEGTCSWFDFASAIVDAAKIPCEREALTSAEYKQRYPQTADRPAYSSLENKRLEDTIGNSMRPWQDALATYMSNLQELSSNPSWDELQ